MKSNPVSSKRRALILSGMAIGAGQLLLPNIGVAAAKGYGIEGKRAPELNVAQWIDGDGNPTDFKLADNRGKFVFMELWQAWCPGCHSHGFPALQKIYAEFKNSPHFISIGIQTTFEGYSTNTADKMRDMQKRYNLPIVMGHDAGDAQSNGRPNTMNSYRTGGTPWAVLISPDGYVLYNDYGIDSDSAIQYLRKEISGLSA